MERGIRWLVLVFSRCAADVVFCPIYAFLGGSYFCRESPEVAYVCEVAAYEGLIAAINAL